MGIWTRFSWTVPTIPPPISEAAVAIGRGRAFSTVSWWVEETYILAPEPGKLPRPPHHSGSLSISVSC